MSKSATLLLHLLLLFWPFFSQNAWASEVTPAKKKNFVVIVADDLSWNHIGSYGCEFVQTPHLDRLAAQGVQFQNAFTSTSSCTPSRGALLTGKNGWELQEGAVMHSFLPPQFASYPEILEQNGYFTGAAGKGWGPGALVGRSENPAGKSYNKSPNKGVEKFEGVGNIFYSGAFQSFLKSNKKDDPFCFWIGIEEPHRPYGRHPENSVDLTKIKLPPYLPDVPEIRKDFQGYLNEIQYLDKVVGSIMAILEEEGLSRNTIVVFTSDNGSPFPRAKQTCYDAGTHMPLIFWGKPLQGKGTQIHDLVSLIDVAPTILELAGVTRPKGMTGRSLTPLMRYGGTRSDRPASQATYMYRERHSWEFDDGYADPQRAIRTHEYLLVWNLFPNRVPAARGGNPTTKFLVKNRDNPIYKEYFQFIFGNQPEWELYDLKKDPHQMENLAYDVEYIKIRDGLLKQLKQYLLKTGDLRMKGQGDVYRAAPFFGFVRPNRRNWDNANPETRIVMLRDAYERVNSLGLFLEFLDKMEREGLGFDGKMCF